ncbi:unnamed protein product, partial [Rotaria sp. Silwood1]
MDIEQDNLLNKDCSSIETEKQTQLNINSFVTTTMNNNTDKKDLLPKDMVENDTDREENETENNFDSFILEHFTRFSGEQDVTAWLDETEDKFNRLLIPRHLRFQAIPLLVERQATRLYVRNEHNIRSFTDFQKLLLLHFDKDDIQSTIHNQQNTVLCQCSLVRQTPSFEDKGSQTMTTFNNSH